MQHTIELSARMAMNASLVPDGAKVADVESLRTTFSCKKKY